MSKAIECSKLTCCQYLQCQGKGNTTGKGKKRIGLSNCEKEKATYMGKEEQ